MLPLPRRAFLAGGIATLGAAPAFAQHAHHEPLYERLNEPGRVGVPDLAAVQRVYDSPAPKAVDPGRWVVCATLPLPRSEMAWATVLNNRMHLVGGYGEQRVDRQYHQVYDPVADRWTDAPPLPVGANHVGVTVLNGRLYAIGGHTRQNHTPHALCFVFADDKWQPIQPLPRPCGAVGVVAFEGVIHVVGGAVGNSPDEKKSLDWHLVYDPHADRWAERAPLPTGRDHIGIVAVDNRIHVIGGRVDNFYTNSNLHHSYETAEDRWRMRSPLPTARSGHGSVILHNQIFCMGGEGSNRVFAQNEAYDLARDSWLAYAPMMTPRHGLGAAAIGGTIYVAGGGPVMGGGFQSAVHEAFMIG